MRKEGAEMSNKSRVVAEREDSVKCMTKERKQQWKIK